MCGLYGAFTKIDSGPLSVMEKQRVKDLAILSQLRGMHSAGLFAMYETKKKERKVSLAKDAVPTSQFIERGDGKVFFEDNTSILISGHSRHATVGKITKENAHPFRTNNIFGMHNGTIPGMGNDKKTDSQELFETLDKEGFDSWKEILNDADKVGAFALSFIDVKTNRYYIIRNNDRTLYYKDYLGVRYFASEYLMLKFWCDRLNITNSDIKLFESMKLYSYELRDLSKERIEDFHIAKKSYGFERSFSYMNDSSALVPLTGPPWDTSKSSVGTSEDSGSGETMYKAYRGKKMTMQKAAGLLQTGCVLCDKIPGLYEPAWWINNSTFICDTCKTDNEIAKAYYNKSAATTLYKSEVLKDGNSKEEEGGSDGCSYMC